MSAMGRFLPSLALILAGMAVGGLAVYSWQQLHLATTPAPQIAAEVTPRRCWEATLFLPTSDNQGKPFPEEVWQNALGILIARFGGATAGERRDGYWLDDREHIQREVVRPVVVSFDLGRLEEFRQAVREVGQRLGQEAMYVRFQESQVELIPVPKR